MTNRRAIMKLLQQPWVNFVLTNRIPRRSVTRFTGWFSKIENPVICALSLRVWRFFSDLDLSDAEQTRFRSMHHCFTRALKDGARTIDADPAILVSPCDAIVGAMGTVAGNQIVQVKGFSYSLEHLLDDHAHADTLRNGQYVTLRLTSAMYHRFHAPYACTVASVTHIPGDVWNVNQIALQRVPGLFCRNERAVVRVALSGSGREVTLVPVAAILVAGIRLRFLEMPRARGKQTFACDASLGKGQEMGWFEHGSTIIVLAPEGFNLCPNLTEGLVIRVGEPLMRVPASAVGDFVSRPS